MWGPAFLGLAMAGLALLAVLVLVPGPAVLGLVALVGLPARMALVLAVLSWAGDLLVARFSVLAALRWTRRLTNLTRWRSDEWPGLPILEPYLPAPDHDVHGFSADRLRWLASDPRGRGGADPERGTGLHRTECRLAAFDEVLALRSPPGGPTVVRLEIPCELSLPKPSSC